MDAADENNDVKLYQASGDLIPEIRTKLPQLLWSESGHEPTKSVRKWVSDSKTVELISLVGDVYLFGKVDG